MPYPNRAVSRAQAMWLVGGLTDHLPGLQGWGLGLGLGVALAPLSVAALVRMHRPAGTAGATRWWLGLCLGLLAAHLLGWRAAEDQVPDAALVAACVMAAAGLWLRAGAWPAKRRARRSGVSGVRVQRQLRLMEGACVLLAALVCWQFVGDPSLKTGQAVSPAALLQVGLWLWALCLLLGGPVLWIHASGVALSRLQSALDAQMRLREAAQQDTVELRHTLAEREALAQRDALVSERSHLLRVLAHEVRQPLHSAGAALAAVHRQLADEHAGAAPHQGNSRALADAQLAVNVLGTVREVLDNVLCVADLLDHQGPLHPTPADVGFAIELTLLDIPQDLRHRIQVHGLPRHPALAPLDIQLFRLALRNLLRNAFQHGGAGMVSICVRGLLPAQLDLDAARAPEWELDVCDQGAALAPDRVQALQQAAANWPPRMGMHGDDGPRLGLGLQIARRVAALHGGRLRFEAAQPRGLCVALVLPLQMQPPTGGG